MNKEKMTIHKGLSELKTINSRIETEIDNVLFVKANKHNNKKIDGVELKTYADRVKSKYQCINDLINRRNAIKRAIVLSNATTKVDICGAEYTVAEAIDMKNSAMKFFKDLLTHIRFNYDSAVAVAEKNNGENLETKANNYVTSILMAQPKDGKMSAASTEILALKEKYMKDNEYDIIDPIGAVDEIKHLRDFIGNFESEVDSALSVSNATTIIEIEY